LFKELTNDFVQPKLDNTTGCAVIDARKGFTSTINPEARSSFAHKKYRRPFAVTQKQGEVLKEATQASTKRGC
jgi:hypothetical protein